MDHQELSLNTFGVLKVLEVFFFISTAAIQELLGPPALAFTPGLPNCRSGRSGRARPSCRGRSARG